jgi:hypothetical protein
MTHAQAAEIVRQAWRQVHGRDPSDSERDYTQAIAWLENQYGRAGQFAAMAARGQFNWGSLHGRGTPPNCGPGSAPGSDQGSVCFQVYATDVDAAAAFVRVLTKTHWDTITAMQGTPEDVARAMRQPPAYYAGTAPTEEGKVSQYAAAIRGGLRAIGSASPSSPTASGSSSLLWLLALGGATYAAYRYGLLEEPLALMRRYI